MPRRGDLNPKTIDQIQKEAENEQFNIQAMNMNPSRKDDRMPGSGGGGGGGGPRGGGGGPGGRQKGADEGGWNAVGSNRNNRQHPFMFQADKIRHAKVVSL